MTGSTYFERKLSKLPIPLIFDFDDAIWLEDKSIDHGLLSGLKSPGKTNHIIQLANKVIAGNRYLAGYAEKFNKNVLIIPTTIDTEKYLPKVKTQDGQIVIGWSGSFSTLKHFEEIIPVLVKIKEKYEEQVKFKIIGIPNYHNSALNVFAKEWSVQDEVDDLLEFDIGIMPLPDNEWTKGKCGAKGLQYMGLAIPTIMSPVGVNTEIIKDGLNGFLADSKEQWIEKLSLLIESSDLRLKLGKAGRKTVVDHYSLEANKEKYLALFQ